MRSKFHRQPGLGCLSSEWKEVTSTPVSENPTEMREASKSQPNNAIPVGFSIKQMYVDGYAGHQNQVRIYKPATDSTNGATIIYIHGGGWVLGDLDSEDAVCRAMCKGNNVTVVSVDYRKAPENPFPIGLEDVWEATVWVFNNLDSLGGSLEHVIIGGLSAGANIAAAITHRAKETKVTLRGQILRVPIVVHPTMQPKVLDFGSYQENAEAPILSTEAVMKFLEWYDPIPADIRMSPLLAQDFSGLPPAYVQVAGADPLRDDAFAYVERLEQAGVPVRETVYPGQPHAFMKIASDETTKCTEDLVRAIKWLIGDEAYKNGRGCSA